MTTLDLTDKLGILWRLHIESYDNESYFGETSNPSFMHRKIEMKLHLTDLKGLKSPFKLSKEP